MKPLLIVLLALLTGVSGFSQKPKLLRKKSGDKVEQAKKPRGGGKVNSVYGFKEKGIITKGYEFKFVSAKLDKDYKGLGVFSFKWKGKKPIKVHGFGFEKNGDFAVRFEQVSKFRDGQWTQLPILSCGTGAELFELRPGKEYRLLVSMWRFGTDPKYKADPPRKGDQGAVMIVGEGFSLVSDPFALPASPAKK